MNIKIREKVVPRCWLEIDLSALRYNFTQLKGLIKSDTEIIAVIKSDAYGHGLVEVAKAVRDKIDIFAVSGLEEAIELREGGVENKILFLSNPFSQEEIELIFYYRIIPTINSLRFLGIYENYAKKMDKFFNVHLKIDTGMSRMGINWEDINLIIERFQNIQHLALEAIFTHFAHAEDVQYTRLQLSRFREVISKLKEAGYNFKIHAANSSATLRFSSAWFDYIRPGLIIYGVYPDPGVKNRIRLKQAMTFKTKLVEIKDITKGNFIGYSCTYKVPSNTQIGIIPLGYNQGLPWALSNKGFVLIRGKRVPILGRVSMDQTIIDLKEIESPEIGEEVVITGRQGDEEIRVEEIANWAETIPYEILCRFGKNSKIYKEDS